MNLNNILNSHLSEPENNQCSSQTDELLLNLNKPNFEAKKILKANNFVHYDRFKICRN